MSSHNGPPNNTVLPSHEVGRKGEEIVMDYLRKHYCREYPDAFYHPSLNGFEIKYYYQPIVSAQWLDHLVENVPGADILLQLGHRSRFIEVKSTENDFMSDRYGFKLSNRQIQTMYKYPNQYDIYRIYDVLSSNPQIVGIKNAANFLLDFSRELPTSLNVTNSTILDLIKKSNSILIT